MLRIHTRASKLLVLPLCLIVLAAGFVYNTPSAHASVQPHYVQGPSVQCLSVQNGYVYGQSTVAVSSPPGGGVNYIHYVFVNAERPCTNQQLITQIKVISAVNINCPGGSSASNAPPLVFYGPYGLYAPNGGYGNGSNAWNLTDSCVVIQNGVPTQSIVPTSITRTIWAQGVTISGNVRQDVTSNSVTITVWP